MKIYSVTLLCLFHLTKLCCGGHLVPQGRVHGGTFAEDGFLPYMATIQNIAGANICAGVIIASQWILTAAHCLYLPKDSMKIGTGGWYWTNHDALYSVQETIIHPFYNRQLRVNDIGLIKLDARISFSERTLPIRMAQQNDLKTGDVLMMAGRGMVHKSKFTSELLRVTEVRYMDRKQCLDFANNASVIHEGCICTATNRTAFASRGDRGGPVVYKNDLLVGIINREYYYYSTKPLVHTGVAYYYDWIINSIYRRVPV